MRKATLMTNIVKYNNKMNEMAFQDFNSSELDVFFAICSKVKDKGTERVDFEFEELKELANIKPKSAEMFLDIVRGTYRKLLRLEMETLVESNKLLGFNLFNEYLVDLENNVVSITVNERFDWMLNRLSANFTRFELEEFTNLKSIYAKECYRRIKQFKTTGLWKVSMPDFREYLSVPKSYTLTKMDQAVFEPIKRELSPMFKDLKIKKIKARKRGNPVVALEFSWSVDDKKKPRKGQANEITEEQYSYLISISHELFDCLGGTEEDHKNYVNEQIKYSQSKEPNNLFNYTKRAVEEQYACDFEMIKGQISFVDNKPKKTKFHNFKQITDDYSAEELDEMAMKKQKERFKELGVDIDE